MNCLQSLLVSKAADYLDTEAWKKNPAQTVRAELAKESNYR